MEYFYAGIYIDMQYTSLRVQKVLLCSTQKKKYSQHSVSERSSFQTTDISK